MDKIGPAVMDLYCYYYCYYNYYCYYYCFTLKHVVLVLRPIVLFHFNLTPLANIHHSLI